MIRTSLTLVLAVALLAACGSGGGAPSTTSASGPTPASYRTQMDGICAQAKTSLGSLMSSTGSPATNADIKEALAKLQPVVSSIETVQVPASLSSAHAQLVDSLKKLESVGNSLADLKPGQGDPKAVSKLIGSLMAASAEMQTSLKTLRLTTTCTKLLTGH